ncbi:MAG: FAD-dependent oxidoreductase [Paucimonas sp.]|nr:FAD-dependent oxidoreductase [Paucimonas sp.]
MSKQAGSTSLWAATASAPASPNLPGDAEIEVCVIGAGIAGLTTALLLAREGRRVMVLEAMEVGAGETGRTTAHFFPPDERYFQIEKKFGKKGASLVAQSYSAAIGMVENLIAVEGIDCEFTRLNGYLFAPVREKWTDIDREYRAARKAGVPVQLLERAPGVAFDTGPALLFRDQAQFHPLKYLNGLAAALARHGGLLYTGTRASAIRREGQRQVIETQFGRVRAQSVVVATNTPFHERVTMHTKQAAYRTYVIGMRIPKGSVPAILMWDTAEPYHYVRLESSGGAADEDILVVGGADHKVGQDGHPQHRYAELEAWTMARFPSSRGVAYRWSGEVMEPSDGLPYLGRDPSGDPDVYLITGDSGNGMTHCTAGAMLVRDLVQGRDNAWAALYDPARTPARGLGEFVREQVNTLSRYTQWLSPGEVDSAAEIPPGEGAIVREGLRRLAVYRDDDGGLHALSSACTHLGCSVAWNSAEKSWDCPCHGSRFDTDGEVLHGPASHALAPATLEHPLVPPGGTGVGRGRRLE